MASSTPEPDTKPIDPELDTFLSNFSLPPSFPSVRETKGSLDKHLDWFPNALDGNNYGFHYLVTLRELTMVKIMNSITDKPNWEEKVFNEEIAEKWRAELLANENADVTEKMTHWIIDELRYKAQIFKKTGLISAYDGDVVKSDIAVPESLKLALREAAGRLENVPEEEKDYHPGSNDQVVDLVHPSLFPLLYGKSRIVTDKMLSVDEGISRSGEGKLLPSFVHDNPRLRYYGLDTMDRGKDAQFSENFQWLPCEVKFKSKDEDDEAAGETNFRCEISSYINNLHPHDHGGLYRVIEKFIARAIPLWNMTLEPGLSLDRLRIQYDNVEYSQDPDTMPDELHPEQLEDESEDDYYERRDDWSDKIQRECIIQPEPGKFDPSVIEAKGQLDLKSDYEKEGLQVIVKLANIHLTPDKPEYGGGKWHVEGQLNERICATALYYYDSHNITESRLSFRHMGNTDIEIGYEQGHKYWLEAIYGCRDQESAAQDLGSVNCKEGRLLTFPNDLQHRVEPFRLADPAQAGHRKILALFLVDPHARVLSTGNVPAQRRDWWERVVPWDKIMKRLPIELCDMVKAEIGEFPIGMEEAKKKREELMEERKVFVKSNRKDWKHTDFSLCEH